jgi:hypothetical protein
MHTYIYTHTRCVQDGGQVAWGNRGSLFLTSNSQNVKKKNCCSYCDKLKRQLQETVDELKSVKLINNVLQTELNSAHIAKHV